MDRAGIPPAPVKKIFLIICEFFSEYDGITLYYNPYGEPEIPDEYLGMGS